MVCEGVLFELLVTMPISYPIHHCDIEIISCKKGKVVQEMDRSVVKDIINTVASVDFSTAFDVSEGAVVLCQLACVVMCLDLYVREGREFGSISK